jgi:integrase/recombinase XerC
MDLFEAHTYHLAEVRRVRGHDDDRHPTLLLYGLYQRRHLDYLEHVHLGPGLAQLNPHTVAGCQLWIRDRHGYGKRNGRTAEASYARIMKIWSAFLFKRKIIPQDLLLGFELPRVPKILRRAFTREEAEKLFSTASAGPSSLRDRAIMLMFADTGCRVGELCGLECDDVIDADGTLRASVRFKKTKGGVPRDVQIAARDFVGGGPCIAALRAWLRVRKAQPGVRTLFTTAYGLPMHPRRVRELHAMWGRKAHVDPCFPHMWRHTAASEAIAEGVGENAIRDRLGHLSPEVLHSYLHQSTRSRDRAAELASLSSKWQLGVSADARDLSTTKLKHEMEELLRGDPAMVRQMLALAKSLQQQERVS